MKAAYQQIISTLWMFAVALSSYCCHAQDAGNQTSGAQRSLGPGDVNLEFSRVYIFVDKSGLVGHEHAVEGRLKSGSLYTQEPRSGTLVFDMTTFDADGETSRKALRLSGTTDAATRSDYGIKPFSKMLGAVGVKDELIITGDLWVAPGP